jgi:Holliday junction resolvase
VGKPSRDKGKRGELEVVHILREHGFDDAQRTAPMQAADARAITGIEYPDVSAIALDDLYMEVRRREVANVEAWAINTEKGWGPYGRCGVA